MHKTVTDFNSRISKIRDELIGRIRTAVEQNNNCIGTFYRNLGQHHTIDQTTEEYDDSPVVVVHNLAYYGYGGFESDTVYDIFVSAGNDKLYVTLNGEAGEDFDELIENVQVEGLLNIVSWLIGNGFIEDGKNDPWRCSACGSLQVECRTWTDANTGEDAAGDDSIKFRCQDCDNDNAIFESEYLPRVEEWWNGAASGQKQEIVEIVQADFPDNDTREARIGKACQEFWHNRTNDQKIEIWRKYIYPDSC